MTIARTQPVPVERVLADARWRVRSARRLELPAGTGLELGGAAALVYVRHGLVHAIGSECDDARDGLTTGDLMLTHGSGTSLRAGRDAVVVLAEIETTAGADAAELLPTTLLVRGFDAVEPVIAQLAADLACPAREGEDQPSDSIVCAHIATTVLAAAVRSWAAGGYAPEDWPARASDPFIARVLDAMHAEPGRPWTVTELARIGAMGRSAFAQRFKDLVGASPVRYLTELRIDAAKHHLVEEGRSVAETSRMLGYDSEDGFSRAFRRHVGAAPSAWRAERRSSIVAG